jgi:RNA polymerase sigma-70 factor (ECF subfamily)
MDAATKPQPVWAAAEPAVSDIGAVFDHEAALEACGRGERFALRALFNQESRALLTLATRILRDPERAQDALCEGFVLVWHQAAAFRRDLGSGRAWVHARVREAAMASARRLPASGASSPATDPGLASWPSAWPDASLRAIHLDGLPLEAVASRLGRPVQAVRAALRQALLAMRVHPAQSARSAEQQERVASAGEFVWGSLTPPECEGLARRLERDPALRAEVYTWQDRLLSLMPPPPAPRMPPEAWPRIADSLGLADRFDRMGHLNRAAVQPVQGWWRAGAMRVVVTLSALLCFGLGLMLVWAAMGGSPSSAEFGGRYMAVLNSPQEQAAWVLVGTQGERIRITPLSTQTPVAAGQQLVLWLRPTPGQAPVRVGRVSPERPTEWAADQLPELLTGQTVELTVESPGGLAGSQAHGPVVAQGSMALL